MMEIVRANVKNVRIPKTGDLIYKDECIFSFDTPVRIHVMYLIQLFDCSFGTRNRKMDCLYVLIHSWASGRTLLIFTVIDLGQLDLPQHEADQEANCSRVSDSQL